ncbi:MAG TPA: Maf family nucleotide pyrophosphatase [Usitatibacter sp.]|nr:Maf family nucleotide pyrophosphatase [Usitatibacter sp.]
MIILASGSRYRRELLDRLGLDYRCWSPEIDEHPFSGETPRETAVRLAREKARAGAIHWPDAVIIGCDQVADLDGEPIGKPGDRASARDQLARLSGREVVFHTALCVVHGPSARLQECVVPTTVEFRALHPDEIERYLDREPAFDCAGSAKSEGLGVSLMARMSGDDPTALIGLPLIALCGMLRTEGCALP